MSFLSERPEDISVSRLVHLVGSQVLEPLSHLIHSCCLLCERNCFRCCSIRGFNCRPDSGSHNHFALIVQPAHTWHRRKIAKANAQQSWCLLFATPAEAHLVHSRALDSKCAWLSTIPAILHQKLTQMKIFSYKLTHNSHIGMTWRVEEVQWSHDIKTTNHMLKTTHANEISRKTFVIEKSLSISNKLDNLASEWLRKQSIAAANRFFVAVGNHWIRKCPQNTFRIASLMNHQSFSIDGKLDSGRHRRLWGRLAHSISSLFGNEPSLVPLELSSQFSIRFGGSRELRATSQELLQSTFCHDLGVSGSGLGMAPRFFFCGHVLLHSRQCMVWLHSVPLRHLFLITSTRLARRSRRCNSACRPANVWRIWHLPIAHSWEPTMWWNLPRVLQGQWKRSNSSSTWEMWRSNQWLVVNSPVTASSIWVTCTRGHAHWSRLLNG